MTYTSKDKQLVCRVTIDPPCLFRDFVTCVFVCARTPSPVLFVWVEEGPGEEGHGLGSQGL